MHMHSLSCHSRRRSRGERGRQCGWRRPRGGRKHPAAPPPPLVAGVIAQRPSICQGTASPAGSAPHDHLCHSPRRQPPTSLICSRHIARHDRWPPRATLQPAGAAGAGVAGMAAPAPAPDALRSAGLGLFAAFPDELVCYLLHTLELRELLALSAASRLLRVFACEEPLWLQKHLERCARPFDYRVRPPCRLHPRQSSVSPAALSPPHAHPCQGSWRATFFAHNPACGRPDLTAADLVPLTPVPGFTSAALYRRA